MLQLRRRPARRGLTLMELVVVMAVLIALAAIIVPILPGMLARGERSSRATNAQEVYKTIQLMASVTSHFPTDWDALTDGSTTVPTWLDGSDGVHGNIGFGGTSATLAITALTGPQTNALRASGVNRLQLFSTAVPTGNSGQDVTFNPYLDPNDRASATGALALPANGTPNVATLTPRGQFQLNLSDNVTTSTGTYVALGLGKRCSIVGSYMNEAPVNYFDNAALSPDSRYSRYGVIFQVSGISPTIAAPTSTSPIIDFAQAKLVRVIRFGTTLGTGDDAIRDYWKVVANGDGH